MPIESLRLMIVTPETTVFNEQVATIRVPLIDGSAGFLPGRLPLIGRLGNGVLEAVKPDGSSVTLYLEGGFVQVKAGVVSLLTQKAIEPQKLKIQDCEKHLSEALAMPARSDVEQVRRQTLEDRARQSLLAAKRFSVTSR